MPTGLGQCFCGGVRQLTSLARVLGCDGCASYYRMFIAGLG
jgi:hypothetical protein